MYGLYLEGKGQLPAGLVLLGNHYGWASEKE